MSINHPFSGTRMRIGESIIFRNEQGNIEVRTPESIFNGTLTSLSGDPIDTNNLKDSDLHDYSPHVKIITINTGDLSKMTDEELLKLFKQDSSDNVDINAQLHQRQQEERIANHLAGIFSEQELKDLLALVEANKSSNAIPPIVLKDIPASLKHLMPFVTNSSSLNTEANKTVDTKPASTNKPSSKNIDPLSNINTDKVMKVDNKSFSYTSPTAYASSKPTDKPYSDINEQHKMINDPTPNSTEKPNTVAIKPECPRISLDDIEEPLVKEAVYTPPFNHHISEPVPVPPIKPGCPLTSPLDNDIEEPVAVAPSYNSSLKSLRIDTNKIEREVLLAQSMEIYVKHFVLGLQNGQSNSFMLNKGLLLLVEKQGKIFGKFSVKETPEDVLNRLLNTYTEQELLDELHRRANRDTPNIKFRDIEREVYMLLISRIPA